MKETLLTNCERSFVAKAIAESIRVDGRSVNQFRNVNINFGAEWGSVHVALGETRVLAQVTCEVAQPKATRPNEGLLFLNVELGPMAAPHLEAGRPSDAAVQLNRILERAIKDSRCVDLESLCIVSEEKVWNIRVDLNVLNHEGNIIDCASVAALSALAHFKHPDVTIAGEEVTIHTLAEKDPIPMVLHHYPVCVSFGIFNQGKVAVADPTYLEERVAEANMVFGINSYRELCGLHLGGITLTSSELMLRCATNGANRAKFVVDKIKEALQIDEETRNKGLPVGFTECIRLNKIASLAQDRIHIKLKRFKLNNDDPDEHFEEEMDDENKEFANEEAPEDVEMKDERETVIDLGANSAVLMEHEDKIPKWIPDSDSDAGIEVEEKTSKISAKRKKKKKKASADLTIEIRDSNSDEEVIVLTADNINK